MDVASGTPILKNAGPRQKFKIGTPTVQDSNPGGIDSQDKLHNMKVNFN